MITVRDGKTRILPDRAPRGRSAPDWSAFDRVYCVHYLPYSDRLPLVRAELARVGVPDDRLEFYYTVPNRYYGLLFYSDSPIASPDVNLTNLNYAVNSYNMLKQIWHLGYERVLVLEDDVAFLKDLGALAERLADIPDCDLAMLEYFVGSSDHDYAGAHRRMVEGNERAGRHWVRFSAERLYDTGAFALSRRMVRHMIDCAERRLMPFDGYTCASGAPDDASLTRCASVVPLAIQRPRADRQDAGEDLDKYAGWVREEDYAL